MKNTIFLLCRLGVLAAAAQALVIFSCAEAPQQEWVCGVWKGETRGKELLFTFNADGTCELVFTDTASGAAERISGRFEMDFSKKPVPLTIRNIPQLTHPLHTIIAFVGKDSMRIAQFAVRWRLRPIAFNVGSDMLLKRTGM